MRRDVLIVVVGISWISLALGDARITFLDAGQSDSAVIQISQPHGEPFTIIVDGGDGDSDLEDSLPGLLTDDPTIELVVLSHPHKDHVGALDWLADSDVSIQAVWWTEETFSEANYKRFKQRIAANGIPATRPEEDIIQFPGFSNFRLRVFNNGQEFAGTSGKNINNDSLVFQLIYQPNDNISITALFTGDIEEEQGELLVSQFGDELKSDIVKVPHHGSEALFDEFPARVDARFAFVSSSGTHGTFKHPRKDALDLYAQTAEIFCTCDSKKKKVNFTATISDAGDISVLPAQPSYFVWARQANGKLKRVVVN
ncbi:MAG: MBL fold metallo-hydrolase [Acidobacteria bacterium]|nr:MBL fold metallo-hydrolase [Acidobacteriota bacterium]